MPLIGFLDPRSPEMITERLRAFRQGLMESGYVEGENVAIDYRWAEGQYDRLPAVVAEFVRRQVAVIVAAPTVSALAAKSTTATIPIVFTVGDDHTCEERRRHLKAERSGTGAPSSPFSQLMRLWCQPAD
jgi:putative ABC transport system substrate-binding protein